MKNVVVVNVHWDRNFGACPANDAICCVVTAKTLQELKGGMEESLRWHIESMIEDGDPIPPEFEGDFEIKYNLSPTALLKAMQPVVTQAALARCTGINPQQLNHYCTGRRQPRPQQRQRIVSGLHTIGRELLAVE